MPTKVRAHTATRGSRRYRVRTYVRKGPEHTVAFRARVAAIKTGRGVANAYAVATRQFEKEGKRIFLRKHKHK